MTTTASRWSWSAGSPGGRRRPSGERASQGGAGRLALRRRLRSDRQRAAAHLLQLRPRRHLLGEQRRLDAVEQPFVRAEEGGLRDPQLGVARPRLVAERQLQPVELLTQPGREPLLELL